MEKESEVLYNCIWEQSVNQKLICVNINSGYCGKACKIKENECKNYTKEGRLIGSFKNI